MKRKNLILLMLLPSVGLTADFVLTDPAQRKDAKEIVRSMDVVSAKVAQCIEKKLAPPQSCFCLYPVEYAEFKQAYATAIKNHPEWIGKLVFSENHNLNFVGLQRQVEMKCEK
jgi:hypothetical protein